MKEEFEEEFIEYLEENEDTLYTDEDLGIEVMDLEEEEETTGGSATNGHLHQINRISKTLNKGSLGTTATLKGYGVSSYFDCTVSPRNAEARYYTGNQWIIRKPNRNKNWVGTIKVTVTVRANSNYAQNRQRVVNVITVKCI